MADQYIPEIPMIAGSVRTICFDFSRLAEVINGETLSVPTVPPVDELTIGTPSVLEAIFVDGDNTVAIGEGVSVRVTTSSSTTKKTYPIKCYVSASGGGTLVGEVNLNVV